MGHHRGLTLVEIMVSVGLLGLIMVFVLNLFPASSLALRRASDVQTATAYGLDMLEQARTNPSLISDVEFDVDLEGTRFHLIRKAVLIGNDRVDLLVTLASTGSSATIHLGTRLENGAH